QHHHLERDRRFALALTLGFAGLGALEGLSPALERVVVAVARSAQQAVRRGAEPQVWAPQPVDQVVARLAARAAEVRSLVPGVARGLDPACERLVALGLLVCGRQRMPAGEHGVAE